MNPQIISIHGGTRPEVKKALRQWIELYAECLEPDFQFELFKNGRGQNIIRVDDRVDNESFNYLVNYMKYPMGIDYQVAVEGFTTVRDLKVFPFQQVGAGINLFIPDEDREHDNIYVVTQTNEVYKVDFGGKCIKTPIIKQFTRPDFDPEALPEPERLHPMLADPETSRPKTKRRAGTKVGDSPAAQSKRIRIILLIIPALFLLCWIKVNDTRIFIEINGGTGLGICLWLFVDYKILQNHKYYGIALLLSSAVLLYGYYLDRHYTTTSLAGSFALGTSSAFFLLVIQRPSRLVFKWIMKREPVVDKPAPSVADFIYMFVLWMGVIAIFLSLSN